MARVAYKDFNSLMDDLEEKVFSRLRRHGAAATPAARVHP
jgi:hypothetical protein